MEKEKISKELQAIIDEEEQELEEAKKEFEQGLYCEDEYHAICDSISNRYWEKEYNQIAWEQWEQEWKEFEEWRKNHGRKNSHHHSKQR